MAKEQDEMFIVREGLDLSSTDVEGTVAKLFPYEG